MYWGQRGSRTKPFGDETTSMSTLARVSPRALTAALTGFALSFGGVARGGDQDEAVDQARRQRMVATQIERRGVTDPAVLAAMRKIPRHRFVPEALRPLAYDDGPLPIGSGQTISQPVIVAMMTSAIRPKRAMKVLEVGTGSGYQAAVLSACVGEVYSIEVIPQLGRRAEALLNQLDYRNIHVRIGDGYDGWPEHAPFDAIILTAAPGKVPKPLLDQLRVGGRLVAPVGRGDQDLVVITKTEHGLKTEVIDAVRFVPMTGKAATEK
jgi:protein-L-isoaspartate(D-aspartate) O-methyltransferase